MLLRQSQIIEAWYTRYRIEVLLAFCTNVIPGPHPVLPVTLATGLAILGGYKLGAAKTGARQVLEELKQNHG